MQYMDKNCLGSTALDEYANQLLLVLQSQVQNGIPLLRHHALVCNHSLKKQPRRLTQTSDRFQTGPGLA